LSHYRFIEKGSNRQNNLQLGLKWIKEDGKWKQQLVEVSRQDITCLSLFLSLFGQGKLRHISVSLDKICSHLLQYRWKEIKIEAIKNNETFEYKAFETICHLANRQMKRHCFSLFETVSDPIQNEYHHYWNNYALKILRFLLPQIKNSPKRM
jgi:hypothetical protein